MAKDFTFEMDESEHECPATKIRYCDLHGKRCECGGWMHWQAVYDGYYYECEDCHKTGY